MRQRKRQIESALELTFHRKWSIYASQDSFGNYSDICHVEIELFEHDGSRSKNSATTQAKLQERER